MYCTFFLDLLYKPFKLSLVFYTSKDDFYNEFYKFITISSYKSEKPTPTKDI